jgi:hypothetical protein
VSKRSGSATWAARNNAATFAAALFRTGLKAHLLKPVEIALQRLPFRRNSRFARQIVEILRHRKRHDGAENRAEDTAVSEEWKIGRLRVIALVLRKRASTGRRSR